MHENYDDKSFENDIALIRLDRKVEFTKSVYPICLPPKGKDYTDTRAFVIGKCWQWRNEVRNISMIRKNTMINHGMLMKICLK